MSLEYCGECDKVIDTDYDVTHEHFMKEDSDELE